MRTIFSEIDLPRDAEFGLFTLVHGDKLGSWMGQIAVRSPLRAVTLAALVSLTVVLLSVLEGSLRNPDLTLDLAHDLGWWNQFLLAFPVLFYITGSYFGAFPKTLRQLTDSGVLLATDNDWKKVRRFTKAKLSNTAFVLIPYIAGGAAALLSTPVLFSRNAWYELENYWAGLLILPLAFLLYFFMTFIALRLYSAFLILKMLFSFKVNIQPFHPDGCGGLGSLMKQSEKLYLGMIAMGVVAALGILSNTFTYSSELFGVYNYLFYIAYVFLASIAFFLPLYALTESMRAAKQQLIQSIDERYHLLCEKHGEQVSGKDDLSDEHVADLQALKSLQRTARAMNVWPFDQGSLIRFACTTATPLLVVFVAYTLLD